MTHDLDKSILFAWLNIPCSCLLYYPVAFKSRTVEKEFKSKKKEKNTTKFHQSLRKFSFVPTFKDYFAKMILLYCPLLFFHPIVEMYTSSTTPKDILPNMQIFEYLFHVERLESHFLPVVQLYYAKIKMMLVINSIRLELGVLKRLYR